MSTTTQHLREGIEAYSKQQDAIKQAIRDNRGSLTPDEFDRCFSDYIKEIQENGDTIQHRNPRYLEILLFDYNPKTVFLGGLLASEHQKMLHLLLIMCQAEILAKMPTGEYRERVDNASSTL